MSHFKLPANRNIKGRTGEQDEKTQVSKWFFIPTLQQKIRVIASKHQTILHRRRRRKNHYTRPKHEHSSPKQKWKTKDKLKIMRQIYGPQ